MKPVELVILMRDKTKEALVQAGQNVDGLSQDYDELIRVIRASETEMERSGQSFGRMAGGLSKIGDKAVAEGARIDNAYKKTFEEVAKYGITSKDKLIEAIEQQKQAISKLEEQYNKANAAFYNVKTPANPDNTFIEQQQKANKLLNESRIELNREKVMLEQLEKTYIKLTEVQEKSNKEQNLEKITTYKTQITQLTNEMARMRDSGQKDTEAYRQLEAELRKVGTAYNEATKAKKLLTTGGNESVAGIMSGLSGIAGSFSAGQGVLALFIKDNERLAAIQTKLQAAMSITIGLQQVSSTLHATSAFRIKTVTQVTQLWTGAVNKLTAALFGSRVAAQVLMGTLTLGLSVAIGFAVDWLNKYINKQRKASEEQNKFAKAVSENSAQSISDFERLKKSYEKLGNTIESKTDFIIKNQSEFRKLGIEINSVNDADNVFINNAEAFKNSIMLRAQYMAAMELASEKYKEALQKGLEAENREKNPTFWDKALGGKGQWTYGSPTSADKIRNKAGEKEKEAADYVDKGLELYDKYVGKIKDANIKSLDDLKKGTKEWWEGYKKMQEDEMNRNLPGSGDFIKAKAERDKAIQALKAWDKPNDKDKNKLQKQLDAEKQLTEIEQKRELEREKFRLDMSQREIDLMDDSWKKKFAQLALNQEKELQSIKEFEQSKLKEQQKIEEEQWKSKGSIGNFKPTTVSVEQLPEDIKEQSKQMAEAASAAFSSGLGDLNKQIWEVIREQEVAFKSTLEKELSDLDANYKKKLIEYEGNERLITLLKENHAKERKQIEIKHRLSEIDFNEELETEKVKGLESLGMNEFVEQKKWKIQKKYIDLRIKELQKLADIGDEDAKKQAAILKENQKNLELEKPVLSLKGLGDKAIFDAIKKNFQKVGDSAEEAEEKTIKLLSSIPKVAGTIANITGELKTAFGGIDEGLDQVFDAVGNIANGFAQGGIIGGIAAVVGEGIKLFSKASEAEKRHQEALKEVAKEKLAMQREYNLLLLEQNLLLKEATTIFGEKEIAKAANAVKVYSDAISSFKKELKGEDPGKQKGWFDFDYKSRTDAYNKGMGALYQITTKTGHHKTGLFGWGKGADEYTPIIKQYDDLLTAEGKLNVERAKTIINTQTMSDENKTLLQSLIDLQEAADKAQEELRSYLQETFGSLGSDLMNSISTAIRDKGISAWEAFGDAGAKVIEKLGEQLAYELFFADKFAKLQKDLEAIYGQTGKSSQDIANEAMQLVGDFYDNIGNDINVAQAFMENWKKKAEESGFDIWQAEGSSQTGKAGAFTTMTQDQGTKLEGLFTSVQMHTASIDEQVTDMSAAMYEALDILTQILENTAYCKLLDDIADDIAVIKRDGLKMK